MSQRENILRIKVVYESLAELKDQVVFVGGATVSLYVDAVAEEVRPTDDIDILVEILNYKEYTAVEEKLRSIGFTNDTESGIICRYKIKGIIVDVMPTQKEVLGFNNIWYPKGFETAIKHTLDGTHIINIFRPEYFIATKIEAFKGRGKEDGRTSTDFEDLVYVLNNRSSIWAELDDAEADLKMYLIGEFDGMLNNKYLSEWIGAHLEFSQQRRVGTIVKSLRQFIDTSH